MHHPSSAQNKQYIIEGNRSSLGKKSPRTRTTAASSVPHPPRRPSSAAASILLFPLSPRWGDDQFLGGLYFLPFPYHSPSGMPSGAALPLGGFFYFGRFPWRMVTSYEKRLCTSVSFLSQSKRPRPYSPPKGGGTASGLCMPG